MFVVEHGNIRVSQGDSIIFGVSLRNKEDGSWYELQENDVVLFTIKDGLSKSITIGAGFTNLHSVVFELDGSYTSCDVGVHRYDVRLKHADDGRISTVVQNKEFEILPTYGEFEEDDEE